jgi:hypothetical protein
MKSKIILYSSHLEIPEAEYVKPCTARRLSKPKAIAPTGFGISGLVLLLIAGMIGCSGSDYGYVHGKVFINDEPAPKGLVVRFHPQTPGSSYSTGITDDNGNYVMQFSLTRKGVQTGACKIIVEYPEGDGLPKTPKFLNQYNESPLIYEVKPGRQTYDIRISQTQK